MATIRKCENCGKEIKKVFVSKCPECGLDFFSEKGNVGDSNNAKLLPETRECPFCKEIISFRALKCRFCNEFLDKHNLEKINTVSGEMLKLDNLEYEPDLIRLPFSRLGRGFLFIAASTLMAIGGGCIPSVWGLNENDFRIVSGIPFLIMALIILPNHFTKVSEVKFFEKPWFERYVYGVCSTIFFLIGLQNIFMKTNGAMAGILFSFWVSFMTLLIFRNCEVFPLKGFTVFHGLVILVSIFTLGKIFLASIMITVMYVLRLIPL